MRGFRLCPSLGSVRLALRVLACTCPVFGVFAVSFSATFTAAAEGAVVLFAQASPGYDPMQRAKPGGPSEPVPEGNPDLGGLPDGPGAEETYYLCSACHSIRMVTQQNLTDERWEYLWDWMIREQGMPEMDGTTRATILDYLKTYYSAER